MWHTTFEKRLESWTQLRTHCCTVDAATAVAAIDAWWQSSPWQPYYLHWDDQASWPDPWELLSDNIFCSLARGLGILYTITIVNHPDLQDACLAEVGGDNLVLVQGGKYILNWPPSEMLNTNLEAKTHRQLTQQQIAQQYN
jgi:hypothetical protein